MLVDPSVKTQVSELQVAPERVAETARPMLRPPSEIYHADIVIVGGGLAGASAATALCHRGFDVVLISAREHHPPDFRAEKIGDAQLELFRRVGLGEAVEAQMTLIDGVWLHRFGRVVERSPLREYGSDYADLVNALRAAVPSAVCSVVGKITDIETSPEEQRVSLSDGRAYQARLVIVATGLGDAIRKKIGIEREIISPGHSLCCGFDLDRSPDTFPFPSMVWMGKSFNDHVSYLTLFPVGDKVRANLFVYREIADAWTEQFRKAPRQSLIALMPGLEKAYGTIDVVGDVQARPIDLVRVRNHVRDGVVLIGDAFCVACPITGTGIDKALTDVDRLCNVHIPRWFASVGMSAKKIQSFYTDPIKVARDASAMRLSLAGKNIKVGPGVYWWLRRLRSTVWAYIRYTALDLLRTQVIKRKHR